MQQPWHQRRSLEIRAGVLLGIGIGGFFDGIVMHQLLQWHHMLSDHGDYPVDTIVGIRVNVFWDGLFHTLTYIAVVAGIVLLWRAARLPHAPWSTRLFIGVLLIGWGLFNVIEGIVNHHLLGIHHVNEKVDRSQWLAWDIGFLLWGAAMLIGGWMLLQRGKREQDAMQDAVTPHNQPVAR